MFCKRRVHGAVLLEFVIVLFCAIWCFIILSPTFKSIFIAKTVNQDIIFILSKYTPTIDTQQQSIRNSGFVQSRVQHTSQQSLQKHNAKIKNDNKVYTEYIQIGENKYEFIYTIIKTDNLYVHNVKILCNQKVVYELNNIIPGKK